MIETTKPCWLYTITHIDSGNQYVGITVDPHRRWKDHKQHYKYEKTRFYNAMRKHGVDRFLFEVVEKMTSVEEAKMREIFLISEKEPEYNSTKGGDGMWNPPADVRKKMSDSMKNSPKARAHLATLWDKRRANMSADELSQFCSQVQANMTPEQKAQKSRKLSEAQAARTPEKEAERQRKRAETVANWTPEQKAAYSAKLVKAQADRILSEESRKRMIEGSIKGGQATADKYGHKQASSQGRPQNNISNDVDKTHEDRFEALQALVYCVK